MSLVLQDLKKSFDDKLIFDGFSYSFSDLGIYAITGESGVGKTTLLRMISGLDTDYSGSILGAGIGKVSVAFQEDRLFPVLTALENVVFANNDTMDVSAVNSAKNMLLSLGIKESDMSLYPSELSGGMKQRVSLARAFLKDAPILLLDEPTGELDSENAALTRDIIKKQAESRLVIIVTHNKDEIDELSATEIRI